MNQDDLRKGFLEIYVPILVTVFLSVSPLAVSFSFYMGAMESRLAAVEAHANSEVIHMPDAVKFSTFATKPDIDRIENAVRDLSAEVRELRQ